MNIAQPSNAWRTIWVLKNLREDRKTAHSPRFEVAKPHRSRLGKLSLENGTETLELIDRVERIEPLFYQYRCDLFGCERPEIHGVEGDGESARDGERRINVADAEEKIGGGIDRVLWLYGAHASPSLHITDVAKMVRSELEGKIALSYNQKLGERG